MKTVTTTINTSTENMKIRSVATTEITNIEFNTEEEGGGKGDMVSIMVSL